MNAFVMDRQVIVAPEALAAFFALVGLLTCEGGGGVKRRTAHDSSTGALPEWIFWCLVR